MKIQFYYTRDEDGTVYVAYPVESVDPSPKKISEFRQWRSPMGASYHWIKVKDLKYSDDFVYKCISQELENVPEPSWEDEAPMLVTLDIQCINVNYSYIE